MSLSGWLVAGAIFIIILTVALGLGWWIRNGVRSTPASPSPFSSVTVWGKPTPGPDPAKNSCQLYQFPTALADIGGISTAIPGTPTLNPTVLNRLSGHPVNPSCLDSDQIIAQEVQHTCTAPQGVVNGSITRCFLINGGTTGLGGSETYFTTAGCANIPACAGQLSLISVNFQAPGVTGIHCLQSQGIGQNIAAAPCNPSNPDQLFRVTRINPGQNPASLQPGQAQNGIITQILDRNTGLCVVPGTGTASTIYDPTYLTPIDSACTGSQQTLSGGNVILGPCTGGSFPGYVWALLPSVPYCPLTGGCPGCTGCIGCHRVSGSISCAGCAGCGGTSPFPTPPQIIDIANINVSDIPIGPTGYHGLTGTSAIVQFLIDNKSEAMYYGGAGTGLILLPMGIDVSVCIEKPFTAQYLNLTAFNTLSQEEVCLVEGTTNCVPL